MENLLAALVPLASVVVGALLAYFFTARAKRDEAIIRFKEEKYARLLIKLQGFVGNTISAQTKREFFEEQYQSWLYASDDVVKAINEMIKLVIAQVPDKKAGNQAVGEIVLAMRKDLLGKTNLTFDAFRYTDVVEDGKKK